YFYVVASTSSVNGTGGNSAEVSVTPVATVPVAPTGFTATPGNAQVILNWSASSGAAGYLLKRGTANGGPYGTSVISQSGTTYTNTGLTNGTTYYYVVTATNAGGTSAYSTQVSATPIAPPSAPAGLTATGNNSQVILGWNAASGATGY